MTAHSPALVLVTKRLGRDGAYGDYLSEILGAEGFSLDRIDLNVAGVDRLAGLSDGVIVVGQCMLSRAEAESIVAAVHRGVGLVALRPSLALQRALGIQATNRTVRRGYLEVSGEDRRTALLGGDALQLPTPAEIYDANAMSRFRVHATVSDTKGSADGRHAAILSIAVGDGTATVFSYDLAHAVALLRHGDPALVGLRSIGADDPYRPTDLLAHTVDPDCWHLPQADLHHALLDNAIVLSAKDPAALSRQWYFDDPDVGTVVVQDSDDDWSSTEQFDELIDSAGAHDVPVTFYLMGGTQQTVLGPDRVRALADRGHSFGIHHNAFDPSLDGEEQAIVMDRVIAEDLAWFTHTYGRDVLVNRNHCLVWNGYADLPRTFAAHGLLMEFNAENSAAAWLAYMAGSGRPVRHVDESGAVIDVFQQATHVYDDSLVEERLSGDVEGEVALFRDFLLRNRDQYFIPTTLQSHPVSFASYSRAFFEGCWTAARDEGIPIVSAETWALMTARRRATAVVAHAESTRIAIEVTLPPDSAGTTVAVPLQPGTRHRIASEASHPPLQERDVYGVPHTLVRVAGEGEAGSSTVVVNLVVESIDD